MVHVPFFNVDLPEPKLGSLIPDTIGAAIQCTHKVLEYGEDFLHPPTAAQMQAVQQAVEASIPREFDRVRKRYAEGKIVNDEQLSSELEDASFDWYRRQLRTSVIGATDEEMEDVAARKLGLSKPSLQAAVQERYLEDTVAALGGVDLMAELREAAALEAIQEREEEQRRFLAARVQRIANLRRQVRPASRQALGTFTSASGGLLLGVLLFKSVVMVGQRVFRRRKSQQRPPAPPQPRRQSPPPQQQVAAVQQRSPVQQPSATVQQQAALRQQVTTQKQQTTQEASPAAVRKTRMGKKR